MLARAEQLANEIASQAKTADDLNILKRPSRSPSWGECSIGNGCAPWPEVVGDRDGSRTGTSMESTMSTERSTRKAANRRDRRSRRTVQGEFGEVAIFHPSSTIPHLSLSMDRCIDRRHRELFF